MSKGKEKINWKFVFAVAIPVSIVASVTLSIIFYTILYDDSASKKYEERIQKRENVLRTNEYIIQYFGENRSAEEIKSLIEVIKTKNLIAEQDAEGLGYVYVILNKKEYSTEEVLEIIEQGKRYRINTPNDYSINERTFINSNEFILDDRYAGAAYYYNGYLRVISIEEVSNEN